MSVSFVQNLFRTVLLREGSAEDAQAWADKIASGELTEAQVIASFVGSEEYKSTVAPVVRLYEGLFGRAPDSEGLKSHVAALRSGEVSIEQITEVFLESPEAVTKGIAANDPEALVRKLYAEFLNRTPEEIANDPALQGWVDALKNGTITPADLVAQISKSSEGITETESFTEAFAALSAVGANGGEPTLEQLRAFAPDADLEDIIAAAINVGESAELPSGEGTLPPEEDDGTGTPPGGGGGTPGGGGGDPVNEAPANIVLSATSVLENRVGAVVGNLSATDADGDNVIFTVNDTRFEVVDLSSFGQGKNALRLKADEQLDFEAQEVVNGKISVVVSASDGSSSSDQIIEIDVLDIRDLFVGGDGEFTSIKDAVHAAIAGQEQATNGTDIFVRSGVYEEQVEIDGAQNLTLKNFGTDRVSIILPDQVSQTATDSWQTNIYSVVTVENSTSVNISGLTINGDARGWDIAGELVGVYYQDSSGSVNNTVITGVRDEGTVQGGEDNGVSGMQRGTALFVENTDDTQRSFSMSGTTIEYFQKTGVLVKNVSFVATNNEIIGEGATPVIAQNGFQIARSTGVLVGNEVSALGWTGWTGGDQPGWYSSGLIAYENTNLGIIGNTFTGAGTSGNEPDSGQARFTAIDWSDNIGGSIGGNTFTNALYGVVAYGYETPGGTDTLSGLIIGNGNTYTGITVAGVRVNEPGFEADNATVKLIITGSETGDYIAGSLQDLDDIFYGKGGDDTLVGGQGDDELTGDAGADQFVFAGGTGNAGLVAARSLGVDIIRDFNVTDDTLVFSEAVFGDLGTLDQTLVSDLFDTVSDLNETVDLDGPGFVVLNNGGPARVYFVSEAVTGAVITDTNSVQIATITVTGGLLTAADFFVIA